MSALHNAAKRIGLLADAAQVFVAATDALSRAFGGCGARVFELRAGPTLRPHPSRTDDPSQSLPSKPIAVHCVVHAGRVLRAVELFQDPPGWLESWSFAPLEAGGEVLGVVGVDYAIGGAELELLCGIASVTAVALCRIDAQERVVETERRRARLSRYLAPRVLQHLADGGVSGRCAGVRCDATVLVSDIRGFTPLSEALSPSAIVEFLNTYFSRMIAIVDEEGGVVDKLLGDGMLAVFGAPDPLVDHQTKAVRAAARMVIAARDMRAQPEAGPLAIGVGLHCGPVIAGDIGGDTFLDFTVLGRTVNVAARVEAETKRLGVPILVTAETARHLPARLELGQAHSVELRGVRDRVDLHALDPEATVAALPATGPS